jgi:hypothetical protein
MSGALRPKGLPRVRGVTIMVMGRWGLPQVRVVMTRGSPTG